MQEMVRKHEKQVKSKKGKVKTVESGFGGAVLRCAVLKNILWPDSLIASRQGAKAPSYYFHCFFNTYPPMADSSQWQRTGIASCCRRPQKKIKS